MDNAAKALIVAGAVFLAMAVVGIGIYLFGRTSVLRDSAGKKMDADSISRVNAALAQYAGKDIRGVAVQQAIEYVAISNTNKVYPIDLKVYFDGNTVSDPTAVRAISANILPGKMYTLTVADTVGNDGAYDLLKIE